MQTQVRSIYLGKPVTILYSAICYLLLGKTISVIVGEAEELGLWYGQVFAIAINWLLREPGHCEKELIDFRNAFWR